MAKKPAKKAPRKKLTRLPALPLDKPVSPPPMPPIIKIAADIYAAAAQQFIHDKNTQYLHQLLGIMMLLTVGIMKEAIGEEATIAEFGRAIRSMKEEEPSSGRGTKG